MINFEFYQPTELEKNITSLYQNLGFKHAQDLEVETIARHFKIRLDYVDCPSFWFEEGQLRVIVLDRSLPDRLKREHFFHELGHMLRGHSGDQEIFPETFVDYLEGQAEQFLLYAALPFYMIQQIEMPMFVNQIPNVLADTFQVTDELAAKRWDQIKRRISTGKWEASCIHRERSRYRKSAWFREATGQ